MCYIVADVQGSLVDAEKLRFDVSHGKQITVEQLEQIELIVQDQVRRALPVYSKESALDAAKAIVGLRTLAGEAYPNPVRVVSVGLDVDGMLANPTSPDSMKASVEFCGGTYVPISLLHTFFFFQTLLAVVSVIYIGSHVKNSADIGTFIVMRESAISAGSRRVFGVTGVEADKALQASDNLAARVAGLGDACARADILALREQSLALPAVRQARIRASCKFTVYVLCGCGM